MISMENDRCRGSLPRTGSGHAGTKEVEFWIFYKCFGTMCRRCGDLCPDI